jgi:hypothetical protein
MARGLIAIALGIHDLRMIISATARRAHLRPATIEPELSIALTAPFRRPARRT